MARAVYPDGRLRPEPEDRTALVFAILAVGACLLLTWLVAWWAALIFVVVLIAVGSVRVERDAKSPAPFQRPLTLDDILPSWRDPDHPFGQELGVEREEEPEPQAEDIAFIVNNVTPEEIERIKADQEKQRIREERKQQLEEAYEQCRTASQELARLERALKVTETFEIPHERLVELRAERSEHARRLSTANLTIEHMHLAQQFERPL